MDRGTPYPPFRHHLQIFVGCIRHLLHVLNTPGAEARPSLGCLSLDPALLRACCVALGKLLDLSELVSPSVKWDCILSKGKGLAQERLIQWEVCLVFWGEDLLMNLVAKAGRPIATCPIAFLSRGSTETGVGHLCHLLWEAGHQVATAPLLAPS